ncbi:MAG: archaeosine biosynthesis radical SAM protein RaSEA [Halobacteriales archaeon]|nr:archaeosine biosynthesis radical SAM protein RaSEA [Halobacteriales archaeon]
MSSEPTPEVYERGRGMDAHNEVMRGIRARNDAQYDPTEPTRVWIDEDRTPGGTYESLTIILNTGGCRWARAGGCTMCGYVAESVEGGTVPHEALMNQVEAALAHERDHTDTPCDLIKIYTSGSFLDEREVPPETRQAIAETFADRDRIVVESLPDFVDRAKIEDFTAHGLETDIAIGLETADDRIRHDCVNKYFDFAAFEDAAKHAAAADAGVKAYLLLKPPFLTEAEAVADMKESVRRCADIEACHTVSMNPTNVQTFTMVEQLYFDNGYRPPWLWSVCAVLETTADVDAIVVSDPVGAGSDRGPHNCGECDDQVEAAIKDFSLRGDPAVFEEVDCACHRTWELVMEREAGYNLPLTR